MIDLLILQNLNKRVLTMYGISKAIKKEFSVLMLPSIGTIKPALNRLEKAGLLKTQRTMSSGGRPSTYYSITKEGEKVLKELMLIEPADNPVHFLPNARIKLACAGILTPEERKNMFKALKMKSESLMLDAKNILDTEKPDFYYKMVYENLICEYKNFISLLEGIERAGNS